MGVHKVTKGLDIPLAGAPVQHITRADEVTRVALVAQDFPGLSPRLRVQEGQWVRVGDCLFEDRGLPGVRFAAPASGVVSHIIRGERRALLSVEIERDPERDGAERTSTHGAEQDPEALKRLLAETGLWPALRTRPFGRVADPARPPHSLFVTAIDTEPLAADVGVVLQGQEQAFERGLAALSTLTQGKTFLCKAAGACVQAGSAPVVVEEFSGRHPAGTVGLHVHLIDPVHRGKLVWYIGYQDVVSVGQLLQEGSWPRERVVALAGPAVRRPRLLRTRLGAHLGELTRGELAAGEVRVISGSVLHGRNASEPGLAYLGPYHRQVSALFEGRRRELLGWLSPGRREFSLLPVTLGRWLQDMRPGAAKPLGISTALHGGQRAIIPIGAYERVMPMDILPTHLLRALVAQDVERAEQLGALELEEEDLALCTVVCPGKLDYGAKLRQVLTQLEQEG